MLNNTLHKVSGCLRATPANHLPILAGIAPPTLRREAAVLALSGKAINDEDHPLHKIVTDLLHCARLKSRRPGTEHSHQLLHSSLEDVSKYYGLNTVGWKSGRQYIRSRLHSLSGGARQTTWRGPAV